MTISDQYHLARASAETAEEMAHVWRMFAVAIISEIALRPRALNAPSLNIRKCKDDAELPTAYRPYWAKISPHDLTELWLTLERARHRPS